MSRSQWLPSLAVAGCGMAWGIFWLPVRFMESYGLGGIWPCTVFFIATLTVTAPLALRRWRSVLDNWVELIAVGTMGGGAFALYITALLFTDVVNTILLFYLTPVWSTLLGWWILGLPVNRVRALVLACGFAGLVIILGADEGWPVPKRMGDWMALISGVCWAGSSLLLFRGVKASHQEQLLGFGVGGVLVTLMLALWVPIETLGPAALTWPPLAAGIALGVIMMPANLLLLWASTRLEPARVGVLLMMEVVVGISTAAAFAGEPFGWTQGIGAGLIIGAGILEVVGRPSSPPTSEAGSLG